MKKTLLALSLIAGLAQAADTTTLYGRVGYGVELDKEAIKDGSKAKADLAVDGIRIGIKGTEDVVDGLDAIYQIELAYNFGKDEVAADDKGKVITKKHYKGHLHEVRQAWVGLTGESFGTLKFGKQSSVYNLFTGNADSFETVSGDYREGVSRLGKAISYVSPSASGVTFAVSGVLDGSHDVILGSDKNNFAAYEAGAKFSMNGIDVGVAYQNVDQVKGSEEIIAATAGYSNDVGEFGFDYEHVASSHDTYAVSGAFKHGKNTVRLGGEYLDPSKGKGEYTVLAGYSFQLTPRTVSWVEGKYINDRETKEDGYVANVGIRHHF